MDYILIGKIVNIHGIKGEVKVYPYTDDIHNLSKIKEFYLDNNRKENTSLNLQEYIRIC